MVVLLALHGQEGRGRARSFDGGRGAGSSSQGQQVAAAQPWLCLERELSERWYLDLSETRDLKWIWVVSPGCLKRGLWRPVPTQSCRAGLRAPPRLDEIRFGPGSELARPG